MARPKKIHEPVVAIDEIEEPKYLWFQASHIIGLSQRQLFVLQKLYPTHKATIEQWKKIIAKSGI